MQFKIWLESQEFSYEPIAKDMWHKKILETKEKTHISFDTENDEAISSRRIKIPKKDKWQDAVFHCEMRFAGGDWESSVCYFRCQLVKGYVDGLSPYSNPYFCVIPGKNDGNHHFIKTKKGWAAPSSDERERPIKSKCWKFLKKYLEEM